MLLLSTLILQSNLLICLFVGLFEDFLEGDCITDVSDMNKQIITLHLSARLDNRVGEVLRLPFLNCKRYLAAKAV